MWAETKRVPLVAGPRAEIALLVEAMDKVGMQADEVFKQRIATVEKKIEKRKQDPRYHVTVKHVGGPDDPRMWERLRNEYLCKLNEVRVSARKQVMQEGGAEDIEKAIEAAINRSPTVSKALSEYARDCLVAGLDDGEKEYTRLWNLGGSRLIMDALAEVREYQEMDPELGEA